MPLTFAHPLAVIPLRRTAFPLSALVIGAMIPDIALFVPGLVRYPYTHSLPGLVTADLLLGTILWVLWEAVVRTPVTDASPLILRERLPQQRPGLVGWLLAPLAVLIGAATHIAWDQITHANSWLASQVHVLKHMLGPLSLAQWLQNLSTFTGLVGLGLIITVALHRAQAVPSPRLKPGLAPMMWVLPILCALIAVIAVFLGTAPARGMRVLGLYLVTRPTSLFAVGLGVAAVIWWIVPAGWAGKTSENHPEDRSAELAPQPPLQSVVSGS
ncbi:DUF4184 family protein [Devriesea agamarum]|uniref:DUF4184 family protein n=1 Tax=Devriesea agamarum TaxID=472569 RepID=UPI00071CA765|nr:DUF4184 family protein [Devriesea agamarum]